MKPINTQDYTIVFNSEGFSELNLLLEQKKYSKLFVIVDTMTHQHCLAPCLSQITTTTPIEVIEIEAGEENKTIETCVGVWDALSELGADRKSAVINLGGGVITDLGGFVASTFRRGIEFINIPTTLLSMVDASVGGKNGVDLGHLKNQIGVINTPEMVLINTPFLETLNKNEWRSGLAEMLKHGLIKDKSHWDKFTTDWTKLSLNEFDGLIRESILIKKGVVERDPKEHGERKTLNYGHTLGHAIETHFLTSPEKTKLLHGEAVAIGIVLANYISQELCNFPKEDNDAIKAKLSSIYDAVSFTKEDIDKIIELLKFDKKNEHGKINFVLLENIAKPKINCLVPNDLIFKAFNYYQS